ncbi:MAG TPA: hypothetical protein VF103_08930, partial [Polyangiaceae bacterium]
TSSSKSDTAESRVRANDVAAHSFPPVGRPRDDPAPGVSDPAQIHFQQRNVESVIDESIRGGACNDVREQWPLYVSALRGHPLPNDESMYLARRAWAVRMCAELEKELPERP